METAPYFGINSRRACAILSTVEEAVAQWRQIGRKIGMTTRELDAFETAFEHAERLSARKILLENRSDGFASKIGIGYMWIFSSQ